MDQVLVLNTGSSSIKYQLFAMSEQQVLVAGVLEGIGEERSRLSHRRGGAEPMTFEQPVADQEAGFALIRQAFEDSGGMPTELAAIGHRVVHGGDRFSAPAVIDDDVIAAIEELTPLAPLHNPSNLAGIRLARRLYPDVPQVAVFDTAFHSSMPAVAYRYALPEELATRLKIRRYGFHGTSHSFVARAAAEHLGRPLEDLDLVTLHLGNGASACAVEGGRSVATSMGMSPQEGLVMGTRSGDIDPTVIFHLHRVAGLPIEEIENSLTRYAGLHGLTGHNDMRAVETRQAAGDPAAELAFAVYCRRIKEHVGAYLAILGHADAITFTAGVGQNAPTVRAASLAGLSTLGITVDPARNTANAQIISPDTAPTKICVIPTDEELEIATQTRAAL